MINNYEIELRENDLKEILKKYFETKYNEQLDFEIETKREYTGFHDQEIAKTRFFGIKNINIVGINKKAKFELSEINIKEIFQEIFDKYEIIDITFQSKLEQMNYYLGTTPVFKGIKIKLNIKEEKSEKNENWSLRRKF